MNVTFLAIADEVSPLLYDHFRYERWQHIDCVLSCGDLPPFYLDFLCTSLRVPVLYVRGNHDGAWDPKDYQGYDNLDEKIVTYKGIRIAGFEGSPRYNRGDCQRTDAQMRRKVWKRRLASACREHPKVVVTHAPPAGINDGTDLAHKGFSVFRDLIDAWRPDYFVHGHTHAYDGSTQSSTIGQTTIVNAFPYRVLTISSPT